ncbi:MAG: fumarylacetoacetate hydrolase family protein [Bacillus sp. (in: firmicutes)]
MTYARIKSLYKSYSEDAVIENGNVHVNGTPIAQTSFRPGNPVTGTVYGTLLNYKGALAAIGENMHKPPYKQPPQGPILYIKPKNTFNHHMGIVHLPEDAEQLEIGASLGVVISRTATALQKEEALDYIEGYTIVNDISIPHESVYRPPVRFKARDGFCPIGPFIVKQASIKFPENLAVKVYINGTLVQENNTGNLVRPIPQLLADVTEFMTLFPGDVLLTGIPENPPLAGDGDIVSIEIESIGRLDSEIRSEKRLKKEELK